ncbi:hypothetical protein K438DRAFT_1979480 [Mycena galopus ATCC 62051]|nr:hypothetical protein K438DRAFT_1979480 [Mycena galopus ATCC 62051]
MDDAALSILTLALEGFTQMDVHQGRAECMRTMGDVHLQRREHLKASTLWKDARSLFERSMQAKAAAEIDGRLAEMERHHQANLEQLSKLAVPVQQLSTVLGSSVHGGSNSEQDANVAWDRREAQSD